MSFTERLKTELGRNKKKSAILGMSCLAAVYYWVPLVGSWCGGNKTENTDTGQNAAPEFVVQDSASPTNSPTSSRMNAKLPWTQLVALTGSDPLMSSACLPADSRNPFADFVPPPEVVEPAVMQPVEPAPEPDPPAVEPAAAVPVAEAEPLQPESLDGLNLKLTDVFVGRRFRAGTINGKSYRENELLVAGQNEFTVAEFHATHVVLTLGDKSYVLPLEKPGLGGDNVVIVHKSETDK